MVIEQQDSRWRFQVPIDCSDTFARRAASATVISPARIDSTIRTFSSGGSAGGLTTIDPTLQAAGPATNEPCHKV